MKQRRLLRLYITLMISFLLILISFGVMAAEPNPDYERPKIGLALGGGSAKGFAHIGILMWMEKNQIPVDYLAGTSMGGLMGGCYAMGMNPYEMADLVQSIDWGKVFSFYTPYETLDYRRKEDRRDYPVHSKIGLKGGKLQLPGGLFSYQVDLIISRLTLPYSDLSDFNDLPVPFRCVAADIRHSEAVVLDHGSLAKALRATMSLPGIFTPVEMDDCLLVDGGLLNNVPADVVREMGADIVIAVDVSTGEEVSEYRGLDSVLMQSISTVTNENSQRFARLADLVLKPKTQKLKGTDWEEAAEFIKLGYLAAEEQGDALRTLAVDQATWEKHLANRQSRRRSSLPIPAKIGVIGTGQVNAARIKERLKGHLGRPINTARLEKDLHEIFGSCLYDTLSYELVFDDHDPGLVIKTVEKSYGPPFIDLALIIQSDGYHADYVNINARTRITAFNVWGKQTELRSDFGVGTELYFVSEFYRPFYNSRWFIAPSITLEQNNSNLYEDGKRLTDYRTIHSGGGVDFGYTHEKDYEIRVGYFWKHQKTGVRVGEPFNTDVDGNISMARLSLHYNDVDDPALPRKGFESKLNLMWYNDAPGTEGRFSLAEAKLAWYLPISATDTVFVRFEAGRTLTGNPPLIQQFRLGGPFRMGTYRVDEFCGENYCLNSFGYIKNMGPLVVPGTDLNIGVWFEHGGIADEWEKIDPETNISLGLFTQVFFGPVYIGASYGKGDNPWLHLALGKVF